MVKKYTITFRELRRPVTELVTKFGGQPVWLSEPRWPLSRATQEPMRFICQIALMPDVFGATRARMAYLFISDQSATWEPDGGENAVILQPGRPTLATAALLGGPTLCHTVEVPGAPPLHDVPCEYAADLIAGDDPDFIPQEVRWEWDEEREDAYEAQVPLDEHKIGGVPHFLQGDEFPEGGPWRLLLQLSSCGIPFHINFGDLGVGYAFIDQAGTAGKFLWQCC